jgi:hypothetical protein
LGILVKTEARFEAARVRQSAMGGAVVIVVDGVQSGGYVNLFESELLDKERRV